MSLPNPVTIEVQIITISKDELTQLEEAARVLHLLAQLHQNDHHDRLSLAVYGLIGRARDWQRGYMIQATRTEPDTARIEP